MRVLVIAEAANPEWTSVPLIGWSLSRALAAVADVHVVTHVRNRAAFLRAGLVEGRDFTVIDNERVSAPLHRLASVLRGGEGKGWTTVTSLEAVAYYSFERAVWRTFRERLARRAFDIVHRVTPLSPTNQSLLAARLKRLGVPFVVGPLNGGAPWPRGFLDRRAAEREWLSRWRGLYKMMPGYRSMRRHSAAILVGSTFTLADMPRWAKERCVYLPENGVDMARFGHPRERRAAIPLRGAFLGRLVPYKGVDMLLEAAADFLRAGQLTLDIVGEGPQRAALERLAATLGVGGSVRFHGFVLHREVQEVLRLCDFLALPSIREFGGGVVLEAMALGVAPIVADYAGPAELVDASSGARVPFTDRNSLVEGFRSAIGRAIASPHCLDQWGDGGRRRVAQSFTWEAKARQILKVYEAVLRGAGNLHTLLNDDVRAQM